MAGSWGVGFSILFIYLYTHLFVHLFISFFLLVLEDTRTQLECERVRLQTQNGEMERQLLQATSNVQSLQEQVTKLSGSTQQQQAEHRELQARLNSEVEERERLQQDNHQLKKQVSQICSFHTRAKIQNKQGTFQGGKSKKIKLIIFPGTQVAFFNVKVGKS